MFCGIIFCLLFQAAIKGKLQELGAYIGEDNRNRSWLVSMFEESFLTWLFTSLVSDEELPDYIMVMVANKKNSAQMADDLSLFLGTNTTKFTTWYGQHIAAIL